MSLISNINSQINIDSVIKGNVIRSFLPQRFAQVFPENEFGQFLFVLEMTFLCSKKLE